MITRHSSTVEHMSDLTFYTNPRSRGRIIRWMLEETGVDYDTAILEYGTTMKGAEYLAINPMGKVPAIKHGNTVVTECAAICAYLADAFPEAGLAPPTHARGDYYRWLFFAAGPLESAVVNKALGFEVTTEQEVMAGYGNLDRTLDTLEIAVSRWDFVTGDSFTAADVYLGSQVSWGLAFNTLPKRGAFEAYVKRVTSRAAYARAQEKDGPMS